MDGLTSYLEQNKKQIDISIAKILPRNIENGYIESLAGPANYAYDTESIQKCINAPTWDILDRGGKRWRPAFFLLIIEAMGKNPRDYTDFAAIPELIHNGTLIVDDIEDDADKRRGKPAIHHIFGHDVAINAGNALYYIPMKIIEQNKGKLDKETIIRTYESYVQEMINLSLGQAMDICWHRGEKANISVDEYLQMCAYKTGTLARLAARLAVIIASKDKKTEDIIGSFAESIGVAFQIQDDILDITLKDKERDKFGKSFGNDIHEGKRTLMVIHAMNNSGENDKNRLIEILSMHTRDEKLIREAISILDKSGSISYAKQKAKEIIKDSWKKAEPVISDSESKKTLYSFVEYLVERDI